MRGSFKIQAAVFGEVLPGVGSDYERGYEHEYDEERPSGGRRSLTTSRPLGHTRPAMSVAAIGALPKLLRVYQYPKNLLVFGALVFAQQVHDPAQVARSVVAFLVMCAASSAVYLFNDFIDIEKDRAHPEKQSRPLPSGVVSVPMASALTVLITAVSLGVGYMLGLKFLGAVVFYLALMTAYTLALKHVVLVDVMVIAIGFVLRAIAGALALDVVFSNWLVVCTLFLALFLGLGKRRREIELLEEDADNHRAVLEHYTVQYLDNLMLILGAATLLTYTIYTCSPEVVERVGSDKLYMTIPFVVYGLFRYLFLVHGKEAGGDPSRTLLKDAPLLVTVLLWGLACMGILYFGATHDPIAGM